MTEVTIQKQRTNLPDVLRKRLKFESDFTANPNPNDMSFSKIYDFSSETGSHSGTQISDGVVSLVDDSAGSTGSWNSDNIVLSSDVTKIEFRINGSSLGGGNLDVFYSTDGGIIFSRFNNWESLSSVTIISSPANILKIRLDLVAGAQVDTLGLLYNLT